MQIGGNAYCREWQDITYIIHIYHKFLRSYQLKDGTMHFRPRDVSFWSWGFLHYFNFVITLPSHSKIRRVSCFNDVKTWGILSVFEHFIAALQFVTCFKNTSSQEWFQIIRTCDVPSMYHASVTTISANLQGDWDTVRCCLHVKIQQTGQHCSPVHIETQHYNNVIVGALASQIICVSIVYSTVCSGEDQRKHRSFRSLAFVMEIHRWPVKSPHKGPVSQKMFPFDNVILSFLNSILGHCVIAHNSDNLLLWNIIRIIKCVTYC